MINREFIIVAPPYNSRSAGIVCLHELCDALVEQGFKCHIIILNPFNSEWSYHYNTQSECFNPQLKRTVVMAENPIFHIQEVLRLGITVYPEIVVGNPLGAAHVVRYFLNNDGAISGRFSNFGPSDFKLAYIDTYFENSDAILFKRISDASFDMKGTIAATDRRLDLTFIGKGANFADCFIIPNSVQLRSDWPETKEQLATLFKNTRYFFCWDNLTSTSLDATLCGAIVVLMQDKQITRSALREVSKQFAPPPFIDGEIVNGQVILQNPGDYDAARKEFFSNYDCDQSKWFANVSQVVNKIFSHFQIA